MSHRDALRVFDDVCDLPEPERDAEIDVRCAGRPDVAAVVRGMLRAEAQSRDFAVTGAAGDLLARELADDDALPERIGRYRVLGELGRGGMGRVLDAEQEQPRRRVALKILRQALVSPRARAWLHGEAQALATLLHPGIPQVYEAFDADGVVGLVMERVDGVPLLTWARRRDVRARVVAVRKIAEAVAHAHDRGLLHRDLKPGNVLVTADGEPKVLDFGLATMAGSRPDGIAGTPAYMAPEQSRGESLDVRVDVFALGLVLRDLVGRNDPDLAAIISRATNPDRAGRYASVGAFADELNRYLDFRPVVARRGGRAYRARKFTRRHRGLVATSAIVAVLLVIATAFSSIMAVRATKSRRVAERERGKATSEAQRARQAAAFLGDVFLRAHPHKGSGERTVLEATRSAARKLDEGRLAEAPEEEAALRLTVAETLFSVDEFNAALSQCEAVVASWRAGHIGEGPQVIDALHGMAEVYRSQRRDYEADAALDQAIAVATRTGDRRRRPELLHTRGWTLLQRGEVADARRVLAEALQIKRPMYANHEFESWDFANTACALGAAHLRVGQFDEADALFGESHRELLRTVGETHFATATVACWRGLLAIERGDLDAATRWMDVAATARDALALPRTSLARHDEVRSRVRIALIRGDVAGARAHLNAIGDDGRRFGDARDGLLHLQVCLAEADVDAAAAELTTILGISTGDSLGSAHAALARGLVARARGQDGSADFASAHAIYLAMFGPVNRWTRCAAGEAVVVG